jgi:hypothetical protein
MDRSAEVSVSNNTHSGIQGSGLTGEENSRARVINTREVLNYIRRQMRAGHSDLMALDMAINKFGLSTYTAGLIAGAL